MLLNSMHVMETLATFNGARYMDVYTGDVLKEIETIQAKALLPLKGQFRDTWRGPMEQIIPSLMDVIKEPLERELGRKITSAEWKAKEVSWKTAFVTTPLWTKCIIELLDAMWTKVDAVLAIVSFHVFEFPSC
jgi:hypothetical protein